tara:strand:- start:309 stop:821 length:513 start_codon:yes stop_codon:yes gene_type:complete
MNRKTIKQNIYHTLIKGNEDRIFVIDNYKFWSAASFNNIANTLQNFDAEEVLREKLSFGQFNKLVDIAELTKDLKCKITIKFLKNSSCIFVEIDGYCENAVHKNIGGFICLSSKGRVRDIYLTDFFGITSKDDRKSRKYYPAKQTELYYYLHNIKNQALRHNLTCEGAAA